MTTKAELLKLLHNLPDDATITLQIIMDRGRTDSEGESMEASMVCSGDVDLEYSNGEIILTGDDDA